MDVSVIIPTFAGATKLVECLRRLPRRRSTTARYEVLVGFEAPTPKCRGRPAAPGSGRRTHGRRVPPRASRRPQRLLDPPAARVMLSTNDDVLADPGFVKATSMPTRGPAEGGRGIVSGFSPPMGCARTRPRL